MKTKTKLVAYLMSVCLVLCFAVIGILAVTSLNMKIGGDINFFAEGVSFTVGEGKFYEENGTTLYTGITSQTGILQGFSMDTDTKLTEVSDELATWTGLDLELDSRGDAILKFNVANDMDDKELYILFTVTHGDNLNNNMKIVASTSEKIAQNANKDITIKFDILDMSINAGLEDFEISLAFSEPVAVGSSGAVDNITSTKYTNAKYTLNKSTKTAIVEKASDDIAGELVVLDRVYSGGQEYKVEEIGMTAFTNCVNLTKVVISNGIKKIGQSAFDTCENLVSIEIPESVTTIDDMAFSDCYKLTDIKLPNGLTTINNGLFFNCHNLTHIEIPANVTKIEYEVFSYCESLESVTFYSITPPTYTNENGDIFDNAAECNIYVPASSVNIYKSTSGWSSYASRIFAI